MDSAGLRRRVRVLNNSTKDSTSKSNGGKPPCITEVPKYIIDLSMAPNMRYQQLARDFKEQLAALPALLDDILNGLQTRLSVETIRRYAKLLLRRVSDKEQNEELRGIQEVTGIEMYLLVAFNVLLDLFMGCTSGGIRIRDASGSAKMLHFRTLDWGMDPLRKVVVQLDFIRRPNEPIFASSITYVGFVGVLTGVRKDLSISLNFRPNHDASSRLANFRFYFHYLLIVLGIRPSISSLLRNSLILPETRSQKIPSDLSTLASIECNLPAMNTTAAFLIFSDGRHTLTMEKDRSTAVCKTSRDFLVITNHDEAEELQPQQWSKAQSMSHTALQMTGMQDLIEDSKARKGCAVRLWEKSAKGSGDRFVSQRMLIKWLDRYPISNDETHYAALMDPLEGRVVWSKRHLDPLPQSH